MIRSVVEVGSVTFAHATDDVLLARTVLQADEYPDEASWRQTVDRLMERLRGVPGIRQASVASNEPGAGGLYYLTKDGQTFERPEDQPTVRRISATPEYFAALRLGATTGRVLGATDIAGTQPVTVITQDMADRYFPGENPLGQRIRLGRNPDWPWWTIVGVVPRLASASGTDSTTDTAFVPYAQAPTSALVILVAADEPLTVAPLIREVARAVDQDLPLFDVNNFATMLARRSWPFRVFGTLFMAFGGAALLMAAVGLYGVLSFGVKLRTQEIGVRIALGAGRRQVIGMIVRQGMLVVCIGLAIGLVLGVLAGPLMAALFFNVTATDPLVFGVTTTLLLATGLVASIVPARRAASVDPLVALRDE
jgi:predicted permease